LSPVPFVSFRIRLPDFDIEAERDTERVRERFGQMFELVGDDNLHDHVAVLVERDLVGDVADELGPREVADAFLVLIDLLVLSRA
jgi:hypothetical protein